MVEDSVLAVSDQSHRLVCLKQGSVSQSSRPPSTLKQPFRQPSGTLPTISISGPSTESRNTKIHSATQLRHSLSSSSTSSFYFNRQVSVTSSPTSSFNSAFSSPPTTIPTELNSKLSPKIPSSTEDDSQPNRNTNSSLRSMSSIATSFESVHEPLLEEPNILIKQSKHSPLPSDQQQQHSSQNLPPDYSKSSPTNLDVSQVKNKNSMNPSSSPKATPVLLNFNMDNTLKPSTTPPHTDIYAFDTVTVKQEVVFVSPGHSHSTITARSSNNDSFSSSSTSDSPISSAIHEDSNDGTDGNTSSQHINNQSILDENFPLPAEPGQINALKHRKSCGSIKSSTSSHQLSLNHKASVTSFSKSFSRPLSNSRPSSIHNEAISTSSAPTLSNIPDQSTNNHLGIAIDKPPNGSAPNPTVAQNFETYFQNPSNPSLKQQFDIAPPPSHNQLNNDQLYDSSHNNNTEPLTTHPNKNNTLLQQQPTSKPELCPTSNSFNSSASHNLKYENHQPPSLTTQSNTQPPPTETSFKRSPLPTSSFPHPRPPLVHRQSSANNVLPPQHRNSASSTSARNSARNSQEIKATGLQRNSSMTFLRRRSMLPQTIASAPTEERTGYYKEQVKAMRELKRRRQEFEQDDRVLVGKTVSEGHVNYSIAYNMLTGIRVSVSRCNAKVDRELVESDFTARHKLAFDINGNELIPSSKYDFKFKDYAPLVFRHLRALFQLDPADYLMSLTNKYILSELSSPGKSGSLFYFSRDYRFIIKTIRHSEHRMLRKILKDYYNHVKTNPNTLISRFYGLHRIKLPWGKKVHFIVMNNLFPPYYDLRRTYDLKGSTLGREYIPKEGAAKSTAILKDLNWTKNKEHLSLGPIKAQQFLSQLERDVKILKKLNVMDYSLLVGIYDFEKADQTAKPQSVYVVEPAHGENLKGKELRKAVNTASPTEMTTMDIGEYRYGDRNFIFYSDQGGFQSTDDNNQPLSEIYFLGVIDCLTPYTFFKRVETFWKGLSHPHITISAIPSSEYGDRFFKFMKSTIKGKKGLVAVDSTNPVVVAAATSSDQINSVDVKNVQGPSGLSGTPGIIATVASPNLSNNPDSTFDDAVEPNTATSSKPFSHHSKPETAQDTKWTKKALSHMEKGVIPAGTAPASTPTAAANARASSEAESLAKSHDKKENP